MARKKNPPPKTLTEIVIKKLYSLRRLNRLTDEAEEVDDYENDDVLGEDPNNYDYEYDPFDGITDSDSIDLPSLLKHIKEVESEFDKYSRVRLEWQVNPDGYREFPAIIGVRMETDEEYAERLRQFKAEEEAKEQRKIQKQAATIERKKKQLAKLKRELEG